MIAEEHTSEECKMIAEAHRRQRAGEDFQQVAVDVAERYGISHEELVTNRDDLYQALCSAPTRDCECEFCQSNH